MDIFSIVIGLVGGCGTLFTIVFNSITIARARRREEEREGREDGAMLVEIGYIKNGIESINRKMEKLEKDYVDVVVRLSQAEAAIWQISRVLDEQPKVRKE